MNKFINKNSDQSCMLEIVSVSNTSYIYIWTEGVTFAEYLTIVAYVPFKQINLWLLMNAPSINIQNDLCKKIRLASTTEKPGHYINCSYYSY